jgi:hypothetical protein
MIGRTPRPPFAARRQWLRTWHMPGGHAVPSSNSKSARMQAHFEELRRRNNSETTEPPTFVKQRNGATHLCNGLTHGHKKGPQKGLQQTVGFIAIRPVTRRSTRRGLDDDTPRRRQPFDGARSQSRWGGGCLESRTTTLNYQVSPHKCQWGNWVTWKGPAS